MALTPAQLATLKANIAADPVLAAKPNNSDGNAEIAAAYDLPAAPAFWAWRTTVLENEFTRDPALGTDGATVSNWSWTVYIARTQGERDAWARLFMGGAGGCNPSLANVRQAVTDIFSGAGGATQRTHLLNVARRTTTRAEKLFAAGTGTAASPAVMGFEGRLSAADVDAARNLP